MIFVFSDGEIISQIKMTNLALAEIKELLKQQVKHVLNIYDSKHTQTIKETSIQSSEIMPFLIDKYLNINVGAGVCLIKLDGWLDSVWQFDKVKTNKQ